MEQKCGHYLGTTVGMKWWNRSRTPGLTGSGIGEFRFETTAFLFDRAGSNKPLAINYSDITAVRLGKWHAGRWGGGTFVVKIDWQREEKMMSSGFTFSDEGLEVLGIIQKLERFAKEAKKMTRPTCAEEPWQEEFQLLPN